MITKQQLLVVSNLLDSMRVICREHQLAVKPNEIIVGDALANIGGWVEHCKTRMYVAIHYVTAQAVAELLCVHVRPLLVPPPSGLEEHQVWAVERLTSMLDEWTATL